MVGTAERPLLLVVVGAVVVEEAEEKEAGLVVLVVVVVVCCGTRSGSSGETEVPTAGREKGGWATGSWFRIVGVVGTRGVVVVVVVNVAVRMAASWWAVGAGDSELGCPGSARNGNGNGEGGSATKRAAWGVVAWERSGAAAAGEGLLAPSTSGPQHSSCWCGSGQGAGAPRSAAA